MGIKVQWGLTNDREAVTFDIFRSETKFDESTLPSVLVNVQGNIKEYDDTTAIRNKVYYYCIGSNFENGDVTYSKVVALANMPYTGFGPNTLRSGDYELGYFGEVPDFVLPGEITDLCGLSLLTDIRIPPVTDFIWHKFVVDGRIFMLPIRYVAYNLRWADVYNAGCAWSTPGDHWDDLPAPVKTVVGTPTEQGKTVIIKNHSYRVGLPTFAGERSLASIAAGQAVYDQFNDLLGLTWDRLIAYASNINKPNLKTRVNSTSTNVVMTGGAPGSGIFMTRTFVGETQSILVRGAALINVSSTLVNSAAAFMPILELEL